MSNKKLGRFALGGMVVLGLGWFASAQTAPPPSPCADYAAAAQWDTSVSFHYGHNAQDANGKVELSQDATGRALLLRVASPFPGISLPNWDALAQGSGFVHDTLTSFEPQPPTPS